MAGKVVPGGEGYAIATIEKREDGAYWIQTKVPIMVDTLKVVSEAKLSHGCKVVFLDKYYSTDGSNILIMVFSKSWLAERPEDQLFAQSKSIFQPKRIKSHLPPNSMDSRIILDKWNFEEREHMKYAYLMSESIYRPLDMEDGIRSRKRVRRPPYTSTQKCNWGYSINQMQRSKHSPTLLLEPYAITSSLSVLN